MLWTVLFACAMRKLIDCVYDLKVVETVDTFIYTACACVWCHDIRFSCKMWNDILPLSLNVCNVFTFTLQKM